MRQLLVMLGLVGFTLGLGGCGGSDQPKVDAEGKTAKAPDVPPTGP